jgi:nicotine blue oxidoreductase
MIQGENTSKPMEGPPKVAGVVLAAGASRRMGRSKLLLPFGEGTIVSASVSPLVQAGLEPIVVVVGADPTGFRGRARLPDDPRLRIVQNPAWREGLSSSLKTGLAAVGEAAAVVVALGDQPGNTAERVLRLVAAFRAGAALAIPAHQGRAGHPVLLARKLWGELDRITGDMGAREVVLRHWSEAAVIESPPLRDIDTPGDYEELLSGREPSAREGLEVPKPPRAVD